MHVIGKVSEIDGAKAPGRPARRVAGGWIADLVALGKAVMLCNACAWRFKPDSVGYERRDPVPGHRSAIGTCDGCKSERVPCLMFLKRTERCVSADFSAAARR